jgi:hypothetical protein
MVERHRAQTSSTSAGDNFNGLTTTTPINIQEVLR